MPTLVARHVVSISYNGLTAGPGQTWHLSEIKGLDAMGDITTGDVKLNGIDGMLFGEDREGKLVIELTLGTLGSGQTAAERLDQVDQNFQSLVAAFQRRVSDTLPLDITYSDKDGNQYVRTIWCRPRKRVIPHKYDYPQTLVEAVVTLEAPDPRVYGPTQAGTVGMALGAGGRSYPRVYPYTYGSLGSGGTIAATNVGSRESFPLAYVYGPVTNPVVENVTAGKEVKVLLDLGNSDSLTFDFWNRTIILNGQASRYYALTGQSAWWWLDSGYNLVRFSGDFFQPAALLTLYWRSAD